jgi:hypothetical protein
LFLVGNPTKVPEIVGEGFATELGVPDGTGI